MSYLGKGNAARSRGTGRPPFVPQGKQGSPLRRRKTKTGEQAESLNYRKKLRRTTKVRGFCEEKPHPSRKALRMGHPQGQKTSRQPTQMERRRDVSYTEGKRRAARAQQAALLRKRCAYEPPHSKKAEAANESSRFLRGKTPPFAKSAQDGAPVSAKSKADPSPQRGSG